MENISGKKEAFIDEWFEQGNRLWGKISNHPTQHEFKKEMQMTSPLVELNMEEGYAETQNTFYRLGKPYYWNQNNGLQEMSQV